MPAYHSLLLRQLKRLGISDISVPPTADQWLQILDRVSRAYTEGDQERYLNERSQQISSRELEELYDRVEEAQRISNLGNWSLNWVEKLRWWSAQCFRIFAMDPADPIPTYRQLLSRLHSKDRASVRDAFAAAFRNGTEFDLEFRLRLPGGETRWVHAVGQPICGANGRISRVHGTLMDITPRKLAEERILSLNAELEQRVHERTLQLEAANRELEGFSYSVSHDLRAPLRAINGFARLLQEENGNGLSADARLYLQRINSATTRMADLIDGLLKLARLTRSPLHWTDVDLSQIGQSVAAELRHIHPTRKMAVKIAERMRARGDATLLRVVLDNLFGNAWKFTANAAHPTVEFGRGSLEGRPYYFIRDNGVGFDMTYAEKLFTAFQRLHRADEFPGTGIGLATVQRIIHAHGGRIWAESSPGRTTTFFFMLGSTAAHSPD